MLHNRNIIATRYLCFYTCDRLGIRGNVQELLNVMGWMDFLKPAHAAFEKITLEYLRTLVLVYKNCVIDSLKFQLFDKVYAMSFDEFCAKHGFANVGLIHKAKKQELRIGEFDSHAFWSQITSASCYDARSVEASEIQNLVHLEDYVLYGVWLSRNRDSERRWAFYALGYDKKTVG